MTDVATTDPGSTGSTGRTDAARRFTVAMTGRDAAESHRVSTPLELLFDLTFVVAVGQAVRELVHQLESDHLGSAVVAYLMVFFAIWWAWMNFTWFASAYDTDDVPYRLLTLVQMAGVLVLAAGVPQVIAEQDFGTLVVGYLIMRVAMIGQWLRAARSDPDHRAVALRYAAAIAVVQVAWVLRLLLPESFGVLSFVVLAAAELSVPIWSERIGSTTWHPHHIAERYGLFTIIVLGEGVLAVMVTIQTSVAEGGWNADVVLVFTGGLMLLFALWWIYYLKPAGDGLEARPELSFWWGYGHCLIFAALATIGGGLEVAAAAVGHHIEVSDTLIAFTVAVPVAIFLFVVWALYAPLTNAALRTGDLITVLAAIAATLLVAAAVESGLPLPVAVLLMALPTAGIVVSAVVTGRDPSLSSLSE